jgi:hypothetical protein
MKAKYAAEIRKGIVSARRMGHPRPDRMTIFNSRHYSRLAFYALNEYRRRQYGIPA